MLSDREVSLQIPTVVSHHDCVPATLIPGLHLFQVLMESSLARHSLNPDIILFVYCIILYYIILKKVFTNGSVYWSSISGRVILKTKKMVLDTSLLTLSIIRYDSRVKWSNPGKGVAPSPKVRCSCYWKESFQVSLNNRRQSTILYYIIPFLIVYDIKIQIDISYYFMVYFQINLSYLHWKGVFSWWWIFEQINSGIIFVQFLQRLKFLFFTETYFCSVEVSVRENKANGRPDWFK